MSTQVLVYYLMALSVGVVGAIHLPLNGSLSVRIRSAPVATFALFGVAFSVISLIVLLTAERETFRALKTVPPYYFLAGVVSVFAVGSNTFLIPRLGAINVFVVVIFAQMMVRMVISHFGWLESPVSPISGFKLLGAGFLLLGAVMVVRN
ncbi:MAG: DMT family transporter [bacterium]